MVGPFYANGAPLLQTVQRLLATHGQICYRVSRGIANTLTNVLECVRRYWQPCDKFLIGNCKWHIFESEGCNYHPGHLPEGIDYPAVQSSGILEKLLRHC